MKIIAFAASNSKRSINRVLAAHVAGLVADAEVEVLDLNDFEMPIFSEDREAALGHPPEAGQFLHKIGEADALVIAYAEHNGSFSAAYKNVVDWASRVRRKVFQGKPTLMLATSPGAGGGAGVLRLAEQSAPYFGAELVTALSVPAFHQNFDVANNRVTDPGVCRDLSAAVQRLAAAARGSSTTRGRDVA